MRKIEISQFEIISMQTNQISKILSENFLLTAYKKLFMVTFKYENYIEKRLRFSLNRTNILTKLKKWVFRCKFKVFNVLLTKKIKSIVFATKSTHCHV